MSRDEVVEALRDLADAADVVVRSEDHPVSPRVMVNKRALRNLAVALAMVKPVLAEEQERR